MKSKEIAEALGVSPATVSLALNHKPGVNDKTRQRIMDYVKKMNSVTTQTGYIKWIIYISGGFFFEDTITSFFNMSYTRAIQSFQQIRMEVRLLYAYGVDELKEALRISNTDGTAGIAVLCDELEKESMEALHACQLPLVLMDSDYAVAGSDTVNYNNEMAVYDSMDYLVKHGMKKITYLSNGYQHHNFIKRREAFARYKEEHPAIETEIITVGNEMEQIIVSLSHYLKDNITDALLSENFFVSVGVSKVAELLNISIPDDLSVFGIDPMPDTAMANFILSHIKIPHAYRSGCVAELLINQMATGREKPIRNMLVRGELVEGNSVASKSN